MSEVLLKEMHKELIEIRKKLEILEEIIIPKEEIPEDKMIEIQKLREESLKGENTSWKDLKKELNL
ncbi:MAG: hypothetical protein KAV48_02465 [Methanomicrobia archaeon]|jgi:hypothetical protein|nr:hypothetical protein [Methanomicrobia archaeon]MCK4432776.1 hypothetical protein [Methanomicrobia archaeon]MCK4637566.1 hypothetical protein [Methanomicrobia archaeon]